MLKLLIYFAGVFLVIAAAMFRALVWPPRVTGTAKFDLINSCIDLTLQTKRTNKAIEIRSIEIPTEYVEKLHATPPDGFQEDESYKTPFEYDGDNRQLTVWSKNLVIAPKQTTKIQIPIGSTAEIIGTIRVCYTAELFSGSFGTWSFIPLPKAG